MTPAPDLSRVSRTLEGLLGRSERPVMLRDETNDRLHEIPPSLAAAPDGLLPSFLAAAEVVWRAATGRSLGVEQQRDPDTLLGYRVRAIGSAPFSVVMLAMMEAVERTTHPGILVINDFDRLWQELPPRQPAASAAPAAPRQVGSPVL
jgi:hypothetical protein